MIQNSQLALIYLSFPHVVGVGIFSFQPWLVLIYIYCFPCGWCLYLFNIIIYLDIYEKLKQWWLAIASISIKRTTIFNLICKVMIKYVFIYYQCKRYHILEFPNSWYIYSLTHIYVLNKTMLLTIFCCVYNRKYPVMIRDSSCIGLNVTIGSFNLDFCRDIICFIP